MAVILFIYTYLYYNNTLIRCSNNFEINKQIKNQKKCQ